MRNLSFTGFCNWINFTPYILTFHSISVYNKICNKHYYNVLAGIIVKINKNALNKHFKRIL